MVFPYLKKTLGEQFSCDEQDVEMKTTLDELNLTNEDRTELIILLSDHYGVTVPDEQADTAETVEDVVACIEDQL